MIATGIIRKLDNLGRIVIPMELRKTLGMAEKDGLEVFTQGNMIILKKYEPGCMFCGSMETVKEFEGKNICTECMKDLMKVK